jgi:hypothetical protein
LATVSVPVSQSQDHADSPSSTQFLESNMESLSIADSSDTESESSYDSIWENELLEQNQNRQQNTPNSSFSSLCELDSANAKLEEAQFALNKFQSEHSKAVQVAHERNIEAQRLTVMRQAKRALFDSKLNWVWSVRNLVSLALRMKKDGLESVDEQGKRFISNDEEVQLSDSLAEFIPLFRPPVFINIKLLSVWLRNGIAIKGRSNQELLAELQQMYILNGLEQDTVCRYKVTADFVEVPQKTPELSEDGMKEFEDLMTYEDEIKRHPRLSDGRVAVWEMGRGAFSAAM